MVRSAFTEACWEGEGGQMHRPCVSCRELGMRRGPRCRVSRRKELLLAGSPPGSLRTRGCRVPMEMRHATKDAHLCLLRYPLGMFSWTRSHLKRWIVGVRVSCLLQDTLKIKRRGRKENSHHGSLPRLGRPVVFSPPGLRSLVMVTATIYRVACIVVDVTPSPSLEQLSGWVSLPHFTCVEPGGQPVESFGRDCTASPCLSGVSHPPTCVSWLSTWPPSLSDRSRGSLSPFSHHCCHCKPMATRRSLV